MSSSTTVFLLKPAAISQVIHRNHLSQEGFAATIELSRSHWSLVYNRRKPLSPKIRRKLLSCPLLHGVSEDQLWDEVPLADP